jgi:prevent-host-death family protein
MAKQTAIISVQERPLPQEEGLMPRIGLGHLKTHASEVVRDVEINRTRYVITNRGEPVAVITPYTPSEKVESRTEQGYWEEFQDLSAKIGKAWKEPLSTAELVSELRR